MTKRRSPVLLACSLALFACDDDQRTSPDGGAVSPDAKPTTGDDGGLATVPERDGSIAKCRHYNVARAPFFGDLHVHTALSLDANLQGTRLRPAEAYRFARGERVGLPPYSDGLPQRSAQLERPLDFAAISDHAEFLGLVTTCVTPGLPGYDSPECTAYREQPDGAFIGLNATIAGVPGMVRRPAPCTADNAYCGSAARSAWEETKRAAADAQDPSDACAFTTFVSYEWSASPGTKNLHRNVLFAGDRVPEVPFSYFDGNREEELWSALERDCLGAPGCDVLTIPHNSNLSAGLMFEPVGRDGRPIDKAYAERRARFEPLVEIYQHKGSSECMPETGPDEQCNYELIPFNTLSTALFGGGAPLDMVIPDKLVPQDYVRDALGRGLLLGSRLGANPYSYGFVASTDTHVAVPGAVDERTFPGHGGAGQAARDRKPPALADTVWFNPGGLAVLWAEQNSRESLFAAMKRREAYGTSGPRIVLRFFGGFDLPDDHCAATDFAERGYTRGVPMGGELAFRDGARDLRFSVYAMRDPGTAQTPGSTLDRVQIVKGWLAGEEIKYAVYDVTSASARASVDDKTCQITAGGADELCATFTDPSFDPNAPSFYYARVLESPSCRWHTHACNAAGIDCANRASVREGYEGCCDPRLPRVQQERAWSSPIFYRPR